MKIDSVEVVFTAWHGLNKMGYKEHVHFEDFNKKLSVNFFPSPKILEYIYQSN